MYSDKQVFANCEYQKFARASNGEFKSDNAWMAGWQIGKHKPHITNVIFKEGKANKLEYNQIALLLIILVVGITWTDLGLCTHDWLHGSLAQNVINT